MIDFIRDRLPVTLELVILGQLLALLFAVPAAIFAAYRPGRPADAATTVSSFLMISSPSFIVALLLIRVFSVELGWLPTGGWCRCPRTSATTAGRHPAGDRAGPRAGGHLSAPVAQRHAAHAGRGLHHDGRGQGARAPHDPVAPQPAPVVVLVGDDDRHRVGSDGRGSVVVETIFGLPGIGRLLIDSIGFRDFVTVQGVVAVIAVAYVVVNSFVDVLYGVVDPRMRVDAAG